MKYYVEASAWKNGDGSKEAPFQTIGEAAQIACPGDEVIVAPGIYREYVDPARGGTEEQRIVFQRNAIAYTTLPADYRTTCGMLLRWGRGDVRETCSMYRFAFRKLNWFQLGIQLNLLVHTIWIFVPFLLLPLTIGAAFAAPVEFLQAIVLGLVVWSSIPAFVYCTRRGNSEAVFAYTFAFYKLFFLFWLAPYCLISVRNSGWMTRGHVTSRTPAERRKFPSANWPAA